MPRTPGYPGTAYDNKGEQMAHTIHVFSAGCPACSATIDMVKKIAGPSDHVAVRDMQDTEAAHEAASLGIRSVPAVVIDGRLAGCCAGRGPDEQVIREALK